jgi:Protein of unknown function (DUF3099)
MTRTVPRRGAAPPAVHGITSARSSQSEDATARTYKYLISMGIRTVCFVLVVVVPSPWRWFFAVGAVVLPYIAVVVANVGGGPRSPGPQAVGTTPLVLGGLPPHEATDPRVVVVDSSPSEPPGARES